MAFAKYRDDKPEVVMTLGELISRFDFKKANEIILEGIKKEQKEMEEILRDLEMKLEIKKEGA